MYVHTANDDGGLVLLLLAPLKWTYYLRYVKLLNPKTLEKIINYIILEWHSYCVETGF